MQELLMVLIVVAAAVYAAWYWMPAAWRLRLGRVHGSLAAAPACGACQRNTMPCSLAFAGSSAGLGGMGQRCHHGGGCGILSVDRSRWDGICGERRQ